MKRFLLLILPVLLLACGGENGKAELTKEEYLENVKNKVLKVEGDIVALRQRADQVLTENRAEFEAQIDSLAKMEDAVEQKIETYREQDASLHQMKTTLDSMVQELEQQYARTRDW